MLEPGEREEEAFAPSKGVGLDKVGWSLNSMAGSRYLGSYSEPDFEEFAAAEVVLR